jgi:nicotinate-nucleotide pyrophosphorylase (carboxylating)
MTTPLFESFYPQHSLADVALPLISAALKEDGAFADITSQATVFERKRGRARLIAKEEGVVCGLDLVPLLLEYFPLEVTAECHVQEGQWVSTGDLILLLRGPLATILAAERTLINFLQHLSGIATLTARMVAELSRGRSRPIKLLDTRKTLPGYRLLQKYAVRCGGGENHREGLSDMYLIKENHIRSAGSLEKAITSCQEHRRETGLAAEIEVEVTNLDEFRRAHGLGVERIMLDHFDADMVEQAAKLNEPEIPLELSGNITWEGLAEIRSFPIHYISSGAVTHSPRAMDLSMQVEEEQ